MELDGVINEMTDDDFYVRDFFRLMNEQVICLWIWEEWKYHLWGWTCHVASLIAFRNMSELNKHFRHQKWDDIIHYRMQELQ